MEVKEIHEVRKAGIHMHIGECPKNFTCLRLKMIMNIEVHCHFLNDE